MKKIINIIKKYINSGCGHDFEYLSSFDKKTQNKYQGKIKVVNLKCKKCGHINTGCYWTDEFDFLNKN